MLRVPSLFLATIAAAILAPTLGLAETPKRGGILSFAAVAETAAATTAMPRRPSRCCIR
mgnify:CR=1 FL=1